MTDFVFQPSATTPYQFSPSLDGATYNVIVRWNVFGERYYLHIYALNGKIVAVLPMIASPDTYDISIVAGYFTSKIVFRESSQTFEVTP